MSLGRHFEAVIMATAYQLAIGAGTFAVLVIGLVQISDAPEGPPRVYVPSEEVTGRAAGHDVVHALQNIVESGPAIGPSVFETARPVIGETNTSVDTKALAAEAELLLRGLESTPLTALERLELRRGWELAATPDAQAKAVLKLRAATATE
ncbi:MAG: hypothetical protein QNJ03_01445 [Dinoroseobacter sp.]|nr:hypothetical protein [Dinoroseobacter sp.]